MLKVISNVFVMSLLTNAVMLVSMLQAQEAESLPRIRVNANGKGFVAGEGGTSFVVKGFNYDRHHDGRLLEDYWLKDWPLVEKAFQDMKTLGANSVRVHLQFGALMTSATQVNAESLEQLAKLIKLAEKKKLYLNLTGLGCYHKQAVPVWYDEMSEPERWNAQAVFWGAISKLCANSSAVFCYDLMNEPVVPGGDKPQKDWLGPGFGGKHYVQFISLDRSGRDRVAVAKAWIAKMVKAIRTNDQNTLITVGMVDWSLDRPGLTSGFVPSKVSDELDFLSVHIYPETGKLAEAKEVLAEFAAVGKPVVIEEIYPLKGSAGELIGFLTQTQDSQSGIFTFYWGQPPEELDALQTIGGAINADWLRQIQKLWSP